jgi:hypothetical protein
MGHLKVHMVSVRKRAEANVDFWFRGFCSFSDLVDGTAVSQLHQSAQKADYCEIFNRFGVKTSKRAAAKADGLGQDVLQEVLSFLKTCLIAGPQHKLEMARGASFLRSLPGVEKQDDHTDFDFRDFIPPLAFRRAKPFSIWIALVDGSHLWLSGVERQFNAGDVVVFAGDCRHSGAANASRRIINYRLFSYVPTRDFDVPWEFNNCRDAVKKGAIQVTDEYDVKRLHAETNPVSASFKPSEHAKYLYDRRTGAFYEFSVPLWLDGLDTAEPSTPDPYAPGRLSSLSSFNPVSGVRHCPHFSIEDFIPNREERDVLNDFRAQCTLCKLKRKRARDTPGDTLQQPEGRFKQQIKSNDKSK